MNLVVKCVPGPAALEGDDSVQPDQQPRLGAVTPMKGRQHRPKDGMSRVYHYEITGGGRIDYRYNAECTTSSGGDAHRVVQVIGIDLDGH